MGILNMMGLNLPKLGSGGTGLNPFNALAGGPSVQQNPFQTLLASFAPDQPGVADLPVGTTAPAYDPSGLPPLDPSDPMAPVANVKAPAMFLAPQKPQPGGIPESYYASIRSAESGGNDQAKNPTSSAYGRYQFLGGTWNEVMQKHPELGLTSNGRGDPAQNERAIRAFTADNASVLRGAGVPVTNGSLYAAHFLGAGAAPAVYRQDDSTPMSAVVGPKVINANGFLRGMSVGQFKQWAEKKGGSGGAGNNYGPGADAMSRPSGSQWSPAPTGGTDGPSGLRMAEGDYDTALANPKDGTKRSGGGGSAGSGTGPDAGGGGGSKQNSVSPDFKRYQSRKTIRHLRGMSPVATIQALENIGKGLRTQGGGTA